MITSRVAWKSLLVVALGCGTSYSAILLWPEFAVAVETIGKGLFWSVPFVLATSLATFNNTLRVFDRIEEVIKHDCDDLAPHEYDYLKKRINSTEAVTANLLVNSLIVIFAGIAYFIVDALLSVPLPGWVPVQMRAVRPDMAGMAVQFGLGLLATWILVIQFRAIPPMVAFYKFFTVDRHLPPDATKGSISDGTAIDMESSSRS